MQTSNKTALPGRFALRDVVRGNGPKPGSSPLGGLFIAYVWAANLA